ncbi:MAG: hypothetical protein R6W93_14985, partial [Candidatus Limnocylindrales bacterium]
MAIYPSIEELRLLVKVSRFYYEDGLNQDAITARLGLSRSKVSRLMAQARETGVVQINVVVPEDLFLDLESRLEERFGLQEALVVEAQPGDSQRQVSRAGGGAADGSTHLSLRVARLRLDHERLLQPQALLQPALQDEEEDPRHDHAD